MKIDINDFILGTEPKKDEFVQGEIVLVYNKEDCTEESRMKAVYIATVPGREEPYLVHAIGGTFFISSYKYIEKYKPEPEVVPPLSDEEIKKLREMIKNK